MVGLDSMADLYKLGLERFYERLIGQPNLAQPS